MIWNARQSAPRLVASHSTHTSNFIIFDTLKVGKKLMDATVIYNAYRFRKNEQKIILLLMF